MTDLRHRVAAARLTPLAVVLTHAILIGAAILGPSADRVTVTGRAPVPMATRVELFVDDQPDVVADLSDDKVRDFTLRWDPSPLALGPHELRVAALAPDGRSLAESRIPVALGVARGELLVRADIFRPGDRPGTMRIEGYALDRANGSAPGIAKVEVFTDDDAHGHVLLGVATLGNPRADVVESLGAARYLASGWWGEWQVPGPPGAAAISVVAHADTGEVATTTASFDVQSANPAPLPAVAASAITVEWPTPHSMTYVAPDGRLWTVMSLLASLALCVVLLRGPTRLVLRLLTLSGVATAALAFVAVEPLTLRGFGAAAARALPHLDPASIAQLSSTFGLLGSIPPSTLGMATVPASAAALVFARSSSSVAHRVAWIAVAIVAALVVALTGHRTPMLALAVGAVAALWPDRTSVAALGTLTIAVQVGVGVGLAVTNGDYEIGRVELWRDALALSGSMPVTGPGLGVFSQHAGSAHHAHNALLQVLVDFGPIGFAAMVVAFAGAWRNAAAVVRGGRDEVASVCLSVIACLAVMGAADSAMVFPVPTQHALLEMIWPVPLAVIALGARLAPPHAVRSKSNQMNSR